MSRSNVINLTDGYIKGLLIQQGLPKEIIENPEFIELHRLQIVGKRIVRKINNKNKIKKNSKN